MALQREKGRLDWVFNILDGLAEQEDVFFREKGPETGFLVSPDLNWDRKTLGALHVLALVERRDIWSLRDLKPGHVPWLKQMRRKILEAVTGVYEAVGEDQLKLYVHCEYFPSWIITARIDGEQISLRIIIFISMLFMSLLRLAPRRLLERHLGWRTSLASWSAWRKGRVWLILRSLILLEKLMSCGRMCIFLCRVG